MSTHQYKITAQVFEGPICYFEVQDQKSKEVRLYKTSCLIMDRALCRQFSQEDCLLIGYTEAQNHEARIRHEIALFKNQE